MLSRTIPGIVLLLSVGNFNALTVYVLFNTGEVFGVCPVLPYNARVPRVHMLSLFNERTRQWLQEVQRSDMINPSHHKSMT